LISITYGSAISKLTEPFNIKGRFSGNNVYFGGIIGNFHGNSRTISGDGKNPTDCSFTL